MLKRKKPVVQKVLFHFVKQAVSIARKLTDAALMQISDPAGNSVAGWKHAVLHFLRKLFLFRVFEPHLLTACSTY